MSQRYFENIKSTEKRRLRYFLLAYLFAGIICVAIALFFSTANGVIAGLMMGYYIGWKLTEVIREKIKLPCPLCDAEELEESFPYVQGQHVVATDEEGDPLYEDVGPTPRFLALSRRHLEDLSEQQDTPQH